MNMPKQHAARRPAWQNALAQGQACYRAHDYMQGLAWIEGHLSEMPSYKRAEALMLLGACGIYTRPAPMWQACLHEARTLFQAAQDVARCIQLDVILADGLIQMGELKKSLGLLRRVQRQLSPAHALDPMCLQALYCGLGKVLSRRMQIPAALEALDMAVVLSVRANAAWAEIQARLLRAQAHASLHQVQAAALDLLWAERLLASAGFAKRPIALELLRAETLQTMMCPQRSASRLQELSESMQGAQVLPLYKAHWYRLMGALSSAGGVRQRSLRELQRASQIFSGLDQRYAYAQCQLSLLQASASDAAKKARQGRLHSLPWHEWPLLKQHYLKLQGAAHTSIPSHQDSTLSSEPSAAGLLLGKRFWSFWQAWPQRLMAHVRGVIELVAEPDDVSPLPMQTPARLQGRVAVARHSTSQATSAQAQHIVAKNDDPPPTEHTHRAVMPRRLGVTEVTT